MKGTWYILILGLPVSQKLEVKADPGLTQDIAYIYEILHCNHFIILSNATAYETNTIAENDEVVAVEDFIDVGNILGKSWVAFV